MESIDVFFKPKCICLIGASDKAGSVGNAISQNLYRYTGKLFFTNPRLAGKTLYGRKVYSSIKDIKEDIDLAVIATPATVCPMVVQEISETKCKNIVMITSGFSESGREDLTESIKRLISKNNIRLIGPNCLGLLNLNNGLDCTFNSREKYDLPKQGKVSIITQSGALGLALLDLASKEQLHLSKFVSYGNAIDIDESVLLDYFACDKATDVILCYIEGVRDGRRFFSALKNASKTKKVLVLKGGVTNNGKSAVKSHTAAIAGSSKVFSTAIRQAGAIQVSTIREMFNLAKFFSFYPKDKFDGIQIITNGGGFGVLTTDQLELYGIRLTKPTETTICKIKRLVPEYATVGNPIDLTGDADNKRFVDVINACVKDRNTQGIAVLLLLQLPGLSSGLSSEIAKIKKSTDKPIFVLTIGGEKTETQIKEFERNKVLCLRDPRDAVEVLKSLL